tara:strand:+ start:207 stop:851 length:645 start_codon:yes stop_codon:yes gene_type:complete
MKKFEDMTVKQKRMSRILSLQFIYAYELSNVDIKKIVSHFTDLSNIINVKNENKEVKSELENLYEVLSSIVPKYLNKKMKNFQDMSENNITLELIEEFVKEFEDYSAVIVEYALEVTKLSLMHSEKLDLEIISRSTNWDKNRITLIDKLIIRNSLSEMLYIEHVPPKVSIAEGIEIAKTMSTKDSSGFVNGVLDSFYNDWKDDKISIQGILGWQ